jgi:hypothetical protein
LNKVQKKKVDLTDQSHNQLLVHEYEEIGQCWRHVEQMATHLTTVIFPLVFGAIILPFAYPQLARLTIALGSIMLLLLWLLYFLRVDLWIIVRIERAKEIERELGFSHYIKIDQTNKKKFAPRAKVIRLATFIAYCIIWTIILFVYN